MDRVTNFFYSVQQHRAFVLADSNYCIYTETLSINISYWLVIGCRI